MAEPVRFTGNSEDLYPRLEDLHSRLGDVVPVSFAPSFEWKPLIFKTVFAVWIGGMVVSIFLAVTGYVRFLLLLRKTVPASDDFAGPWRRLLEEHGIDARTIPMLVSNGGHDLGPALVRTIRGYRLVIPHELWSELSESGRCGILKHEREHFRRHDVWKSFIVRILALPHWFNPMAHLAVHRFEEAAELLCDRAAFECRREGAQQRVAVEFAETLLLLHENAPTQFVVRQSIFGRGLKHRVACLLHENQNERVSTMKKIFLITGTVVVLAVFLFRIEFVEKTVAQASESKKETAPVHSGEMVELRLKVVDQEKNPMPDSQVELYYGSNQQYTCRFETGPDGIGVTKIPVAAATQETQGAVRCPGKGMASGFSLWDFPKDWNPSKPLESTVSVWKRNRIFTGMVVDAEGKPVAGAVVGSSFDPPLVLAETDEKGRFEYYDYENPIESLFAFKDGVGGAAICPDYDDPKDKWKAMNPEGREEWKKREKHNNGPFTLQLSKGEAISVRVVDPEGNPVEGVWVAPTSFSTDYRYTKEVRGWNTWWMTSRLNKKTDRNGTARFDSLPTEGYDMVCFDAFGDDPRIEKESKSNHFGSGNAVWRKHTKNNDIVVSLPKQVMVEGSVRTADGSPPPTRMQISVIGSSGWSSCGPWTDYAGNFSFPVKANEAISVQPISDFRNSPNIGVAKARLNVPVGSGRAPAPRFDFVLGEGTRVFGTISKDGEKTDSGKTYVNIFDAAYDKKDGDLEMSRLFVLCDIDEKGEYEARLPDGVYRFEVNREKIPGTLEIKGETEKRFDLKL